MKQRSQKENDKDRESGESQETAIFYFVRELSVRPVVESCLSQPKYVWLYTKYL